jgi:hypothetical protein
MEPLLLLSALSIGFLGSFHCLAMCGPIALALPKKTGKSWVGTLWYNLGRTTGYSILGLAAGLFHQVAVFAGLQRWISLIAGVGLLLFLVLNGERKFWKIPGLRKLLNALQARLRTYLKSGGSAPYYHIGLLNSFLPCGFVYLGLAAASTQSLLHESMFYMTAFGLGTIPAMWAVSVAGRFFTPQRSRWIPPLLNGLAYLVAILLIIRGLDLGIAFLSPALDASVAECG